MKQIIIAILALISGFAAASEQRYKYVADSPVANVIYCSETPNEHGIISMPDINGRARYRWKRT